MVAEGDAVAGYQLGDRFPVGAWRVDLPSLGMREPRQAAGVPAAGSRCGAGGGGAFVESASHRDCDDGVQGGGELFGPGPAAGVVVGGRSARAGRDGGHGSAQGGGSVQLFAGEQPDRTAEGAAIAARGSQAAFAMKWLEHLSVRRLNWRHGT